MGIPTKPFSTGHALVEGSAPKLSHSSLDGILHFEYREDGPGSHPPQISIYNSLIISVQEDPIRIIAERDGQSERFTLERDDIALVHAGSLVSCQWLDPAKIILIHTDPDTMQRFVQTELKVLMSGHRFAHRMAFRDPDLRRAAEKMRETLEDGQLGADVLFDALARMFLVMLVRRYGKPVDPPLGMTVSLDHQFGPQQYAHVVDFIEKNLNVHLSPAMMASELGMSEASFSRKFKAKVGQTPMRFVTQVRLEVACRLLGQRSVSLGQIAARCGFADQAHLSRSFKRHLGVSPSQFRASLQSA